MLNSRTGIAEIPSVVSYRLDYALAGGLGGGDQRGGELLVAGKAVSHPVPVAGERLGPVTAAHGAACGQDPEAPDWNRAPFIVRTAHPPRRSSMVAAPAERV